MPTAKVRASARCCFTKLSKEAAAIVAEHWGEISR
jgi:hypothetical protein